MAIIKSNDRFKLIKIANESTLSSISVTNGYIIFCEDTKNLYIDSNNSRKKVGESSVPASCTVSNTGLMTFKNSSNSTLFTAQLPLYDGGVN